VAMQFYASPEQVQRDRSEYARKGIARGRSAVVLTYEGGVLFVAENLTSLRKISEIYDRIGFAAVGRYNEFENLRRAGVRMADLNGFSYDRRDVTGRGIANAYTQTLGAIFTETQKPYEVEICVAQVGATPEQDELYRITYDGSVNDEPGFMAMGGQAEAISNVLKSRHQGSASLNDALSLAVEALASIGGENGSPRELGAAQLEVAVLDRSRKGRAFRRIAGAALTTLLGGGSDTPEKELGDAGASADAAPPAPGPQKPTVSAASADLEDGAAEDDKSKS
jgi:proteasome alpha subunit